jgi:hypothetical protein
MKFHAVLTMAILLTAVGAQATTSAKTMLRDAAISHDEHRIRLLIDKEVQAEHRRNFHALDKAIGALSRATDPLTSR